MNTPIYKISDRAPEFPCWLWSWLEGEWQQREHLIGDVDTLYDFTHWCHSETRPTVTPKDDTTGGPLRPLPGTTFDVQPTPSAPDVQRVAEEIVRAVVRSHIWQFEVRVAEIAAILTRFAAELTAQKDAEIARLNKACDAFSNAEILSGDWKARAEKAEAELAEAKEHRRILGDDKVAIMADRDQLRTQLAASEARHADAQTAIRNGLEREDALKAQLAAAQEDTERLDVLQEKWVVWPGKPSNSLREEADRLRAARKEAWIIVARAASGAMASVGSGHVLPPPPAI